MSSSEHTWAFASRQERPPFSLRLPTAPSLTTLGALAVVAVGNAFWSRHPEWQTARSLILFGACMLILVSRAWIGRELAAVDVARNAEGRNSAWWSGVSPATVGTIGTGLLLIVLGGELVPDDYASVLHVRLLLLTPACLLLLYDWHRARQLLFSRTTALATNPVEIHGELALESLVFRATWIAIGAVAVVGIGNALWGLQQPWLTLRSVIYYAVLFAILWHLYGGVDGVLSHLATAMTDERRRVHCLSRDWVVEEDATRDRAWSTRAILEALDLKPGMGVADVGTGGGFFALKMAPIVGPKGRVVATDISPIFVTRLHEQARRRQLNHLRVQLVDPQRPLPLLEQVERVLVANVYLFSMADPARGRALLEHLASSLRAGGKLVLYSEFVHETGWIASPEWPPLSASEADASALIEWSAPWFDRISDVSLPPRSPDGPPLAPHEKPGYLIVLKRRG